jgi:HEAT repeat protein
VPDLHSLLTELTGNDESGAEAAALTLAEAGPAAMPLLGPLLESTNPDHRWWAVRTLAAMSQPRPEWLRGALNDADPDVRAAAALGLVAHPDHSAHAELISLLDDHDSLVADLASKALAALGKPVVPMLLKAYEGAKPGARIHIVRTLAQIQDPQAIHLMMNAMEDGSAALHYWAQEGLERLGLDMVYLNPE